MQQPITDTPRLLRIEPVTYIHMQVPLVQSDRDTYLNLNIDACTMSVDSVERLPCHRGCAQRQERHGTSTGTNYSEVSTRRADRWSSAKVSISFRFVFFGPFTIHLDIYSISSRNIMSIIQGREIRTVMSASDAVIRFTMWISSRPIPYQIPNPHQEENPPADLLMPSALSIQPGEVAIYFRFQEVKVSM